MFALPDFDLGRGVSIRLHAQLPFIVEVVTSSHNLSDWFFQNARAVLSLAAPTLMRPFIVVAVAVDKPASRLQFSQR